MQSKMEITIKFGLKFNLRKKKDKNFWYKKNLNFFFFRKNFSFKNEIDLKFYHRKKPFKGKGKLISYIVNH